MIQKTRSGRDIGSQPSTLGWRLLLVGLLLLGGAVPVAAQSYTLAPAPFQTFLDNNGRIISNGCIWTYVAGTSTAATTYSDTAGTPNLNPIRSGTDGRFVAYLATGSSYKFVYESNTCNPPSTHGAILKTQDNVGATPSTASTVDVVGTAGESLTAGQCVYLSAGDGSKTVGQWYKCDSANTYSSTSNWVGLAVVNIAAAGTGSIRLSGGMTGLTSLSVGSTYYAGTAGALTATAPANARKLGQADTATTLVVAANPPVVAPCYGTPVGKTANYSAALCDIVQITSGTITVTLPAASTCSATQNHIGVKNDVANIQTIARTGSDTIDGATSFSTTGTQYESFDFVCNAAGTGWMVR